MVGDDHEGCGRGSLGGDARELLSERLARQARKRRIVVNQRLTDGCDGRRLVDKRNADDVLGRGNGLGRGHVRPGPGSRRLVEGLDEARQGRVAVRTNAHGHRVFDLLQGHDVGTQGVDRRDDLGLLVREGLARERAAHLALLRHNEGTRTVGVTRASGLVHAQVGEVVEDVEGRHARVASDRGGARTLPRDGDGRAVRMPGDHGGWLENECPLPGFEDNRPREGHVVADARGRAVSQVGVGDLGGRPLQQVRVRAIIQGDDARGIGRLVVAGRLPGCDHVGGRAQRALTRGEGKGAVLVRLVVVGNGPRALGSQEHRLVGFCLIGGGDAGHRRRGHGLTALDVAHGGHRQLGKALRVSLRGRRGELTNRSGDAHARSDRWNLAVLPRVDKQSVRTRAPLIPRATRAGGLDRVAVQRRAQAGLGLRVRGRHNAKRHHGGPHHRGIIPRTHGLNIRDRRIDEAWAGVARLRGIHVSGLAGISLTHIGRPGSGHKPDRGERERAKYS